MIKFAKSYCLALFIIITYTAFKKIKSNLIYAFNKFKVTYRKMLQIIDTIF